MFDGVYWGVERVIITLSKFIFSLFDSLYGTSCRGVVTHTYELVVKQCVFARERICTVFLVQK